MKARVDAIIHRDQAEYLDNITTQNDPLLAEMEAYAGEYRVPIADREVALFLEITARAIAAKTSAASLYALVAPAGKKIAPVGEWNQSKVVVDGARVEHWLNGV